MKSVHDVEPKLKCDNCDSKFYLPEDLDSHKVKVHPPSTEPIENQIKIGQGQCNACGETLRDFCGTMMHVAIFHPEVLKTFQEKAEAWHEEQANMAFVENAVKLEPLDEDDPLSMSMTMSAESGQKQFLCHLCGLDFGHNASKMRKHISLKHEKEGKHYRCDNCNMMFKTKKEQESHEIDCDVKGELCPVCFLIADLSVHTHMKKCNMCDLKFTSGRTLKQHKEQMHDQPPTPKDATSVTKVKRGFKNAKLKGYPDALKRMSDGTFACGICEADFGRQVRQLKYHLTNHKIHNLDFRCLKCNKMFRDQMKMIHHAVVCKKELKSCPKCHMKVPSLDLHNDKLHKPEDSDEVSNVNGDSVLEDFEAVDVDIDAIKVEDSEI